MSIRRMGIRPNEPFSPSYSALLASFLAALVVIYVCGHNPLRHDSVLWFRFSLFRDRAVSFFIILRFSFCCVIIEIIGEQVHVDDDMYT